ncbi:MAG: sigma-70 family RNA polymerase sigma factor [Paramuribaculum sp.]|nr:sigma-70 family RNA polymerase sigma factor [Paramuribaculum sp.]
MVLCPDISFNANPLLLLAAKITGNDKSACSDSEERFMRLISAHSGIINSICYSYARNSFEFDDLRQDVLVNLWRGLDSFRGESSEVTWIYRVALNTCVSAARRSASRKETFPLSGIIEPAEDSNGESDHIILLYEMIASLPFEERAVILMWLDEMPYEEIAEVMGYPRNTVAVKLHRIKEKLKCKINQNNKS